MSGPRDRGTGRGLRVAARIGLWSLVLWTGAMAAAALAGPQALGGVAAGGALTLCSYAVHLALTRSWMSGRARRSARVYLWFLWLLKWPLVCAVLYAALSTNLAAPSWLCLGVGIVPIAATLFALYALLGGGGLGRAQGEIA